MQSYAGTVAAPYPAYIYAQSQPGLQAAPVYGAPPPLAPHQLSRSQSSRYDPSLPPSAPGSYMAQIGGPPVIPPDPRQPVPRPRRFTEREEKPLKSALKKSGGSGAGPAQNGNLQRSHTVPGADPNGRRGREVNASGGTISRGHSLSGSDRQLRATSLSRPRSRSRSRHNFTPGHLILSLSGTCRMDLSSVIFQETVDNIRERVLSMWLEGVMFQTYHDETNEYKVRFCGAPWTARGTLGAIAMKMILELFAVLSRQGYTCISAIDTGRSIKTPRLVFARGQPEPTSEFGMMIFTHGRRRIQLINLSHQYCDSLMAVLRGAFPYRIRSATRDPDDTFIIEMDRLDFNKIADLLIASILEHASELGWKLEGTIPLSHSGFLGFLQSRKELWIFRH